MPTEYQEILLDEFELLRQRGIEAQPVADSKSLDQMTAAGVELVSPPADQLERARTQVKHIWDSWAAENPVNKEAYDAALKALGLA